MPIDTKLYIAPAQGKRMSYGNVVESIVEFLETMGAHNAVFKDQRYLDKVCPTQFLGDFIEAKLNLNFHIDDFKPKDCLKSLSPFDSSLYTERNISMSHHNYPIHDNHESCIQQAKNFGADSELIEASEFITVSLHHDDFSTQLLNTIAQHLSKNLDLAVYTVDNNIEPEYTRI